jgi:hypothetical protein
MDAHQLGQLHLQTGYVFEKERLSMKSWGMSARLLS